MKAGEVKVVQNKEYLAVKTVMIGKSYPCDDCIAKTNLSLCRTLPDCAANFVHFKLNK